LGPLDGVRVIDVTRILAGPLATQVLADLGCDVVKIERPGVGDDTRGWVPPRARDADGREVPDSAYFQSVNRGKRSVTVDLASPDGAALVTRLAASADVFVENFKVGALARQGLDYPTLAAINPRLVYCSITGYGQTGPMATEPGYDPIAQARGGMMSITGSPDDGEPVRCGVAVIDVLTGVYTALAVTAALHRRRDTGRGQYIDMALLDVQMASLVNVGQSYLSAGVVAKPLGSAHPSVVPSQAFRASDGYVMLSAANDAQFARLCRAAGRADLLDDARFATNEARVRHRAEVEPVIAAFIATRPRAFWVAELSAAGVSCAPINNIAEAFAEPQVVARGLRVELPDPRLGVVPVVASPLRFSESTVEYRRPPPVLGEHTADVLRSWLGMDDAEISKLRDGGVV
jgi:crotonobetainyl-CoA:carnitine CoA-transferase CaiB-like acyl-CoA transferase